MVAHSCSVLIADLIVAPYHLAWGDSVYAKVTAFNIIGQSLESPQGNGAIILTVPSEPLGLQDVPTITSSSQVGLQWSQGQNDGGTAVIDYQVSYGVSSGSFTT